MGVQTKKGEVAYNYCLKYPNLTDHALAKKLYADNKLLYKDVEDARAKVRYYRGHNGQANRDDIASLKAIKPTNYNTTANQFRLPDSYAEPKKPYILPKAHNNILMISDLHIPYHDVAAITEAFKYGKEHEVNTIFINGDLLDFHQISRFDKNPNAQKIKIEFDTCLDFLSRTRDIFPDAAIHWLKGNHDKRYEKWLFSKAPEIFDDEYYQLENRLQLNSLKINLIDDMQLVKAGKLFITHGHLILKGVFAPVNAARGVYLQAKASTIIGHTHSVSEHNEKTLKDELITCWSMGCLCELRPNYNPYANKYSHGFAHVKVENNGNFHVKNYRIFNGRIV